MSTDLNPRESYGQLFFLDNTIESLEGTIDIQIGLATSTADLVLNRNVLLARGKTLSLEDHSAPYNRVALSMVNGVLVVGTGGLGLRVGDIEIYQDTIESTAGSVDFKIGNTSATANLVIGRNLSMATGKAITGNVNGLITHAVRNAGNVTGTTLVVNFATDAIVHCSFTDNFTVDFSNHTIGRVITLIATNTSAGDSDVVTAGISAANIQGDNTLTVSNQTTAIITYYCTTGLDTGVFASAVYA